jgi:hypothetical protein
MRDRTILGMGPETAAYGDDEPTAVLRMVYRPRGLSLLHDRVVDGAGLRKRLYTEFALENGDAPFVLLECGGPVPRHDVEDHQLPVDIFSQVIDAQIAACILDGFTIVAPCRLCFDQRGEGIEVELFMHAALFRHPQLKLRRSRQ